MPLPVSEADSSAPPVPGDKEAEIVTIPPAGGVPQGVVQQVVQDLSDPFRVQGQLGQTGGDVRDQTNALRLVCLGRHIDRGGHHRLRLHRAPASRTCSSSARETALMSSDSRARRLVWERSSWVVLAPNVATSSSSASR